MRTMIPLLPLALIAACSQQQPAAAPEASARAPAVVEASPPPAPAAWASSRGHATTLALEELGDELTIGQPIPAGSSFAELGAQASNTCRTISSPDYPGVYAIVEGGKVRRITLGKGSAVELAEGIGASASEAEVRQRFGGFRETPHKYVDAPGKYLTAPNAASGDAALRFEIGADRKVSLIHVGTMPVLGYVEGCS